MVVSDAAVNCNQRFPLIAVVPVTRTPAQGALLSSIDKQRVRRRYGKGSPEELEAIDAGLCLYLGLDPEP